MDEVLEHGIAAYAIELNARLYGEDALTALGRGYDALDHARAQVPS